MALRPYRRKAQFYETDGMGIIYHGNYIHWMEEARLDMLEQLGWPYEKVRAAGLDFPGLLDRLITLGVQG